MPLLGGGDAISLRYALHAAVYTIHSPASLDLNIRPRSVLIRANRGGKYVPGLRMIPFRNLAFISEGGGIADELSEERRPIMRVKTRIKAGFVTAEST